MLVGAHEQISLNVYVWIPLGESLLIERFKPVWNMVIDGFSNNAPGKRRFSQHRSLWDVLHPGRPGPRGGKGVRPLFTLEWNSNSLVLRP